MCVLVVAIFPGDLTQPHSPWGELELKDRLVSTTTTVLRYGDVHCGYRTSHNMEARMEGTRDSHSHQRHHIFASVGWLLSQLFTSILPFAQHVHGILCRLSSWHQRKDDRTCFNDPFLTVRFLFWSTKVVPFQQSQGWLCHCRRKNPPFSYESTLLVSERWDAWDCLTVRKKEPHFFRLSYQAHQRSSLCTVT